MTILYPNNDEGRLKSLLSGRSEVLPGCDILERQWNTQETRLHICKEAECNIHLLVPYPADNSDSPSVVEQSQQGHSL